MDPITFTLLLFIMGTCAVFIITIPLIIVFNNSSSSLCDGVTCPAATSDCKVAGTCQDLDGSCSAETNAPDGTACNDGDAGTDNDVCTAGVCAGVTPPPPPPAPPPAPLCEGVVCPDASDSCKVAGSCQESDGSCSAETNADDGTACDDGDAGTDNDVCTAGVCAGVAPPPPPAPTPSITEPTWVLGEPGVNCYIACEAEGGVCTGHETDWGINNSSSFEVALTEACLSHQVACNFSSLCTAGVVGAPPALPWDQNPSVNITTNMCYYGTPTGTNLCDYGHDGTDSSYKRLCRCGPPTTQSR